MKSSKHGLHRVNMSSHSLIQVYLLVLTRILLFVCCSVLGVFCVQNILSAKIVSLTTVNLEWLIAFFMNEFHTGGNPDVMLSYGFLDN
ncbi:hypothetical protein BDA99DRAFT_524777 [Phascolomyces articulosus]|uniref:Uncharacterized protein n=1 Tax=Phascolomyces articulosus TaxID=60185 RepID=A0AAD5P8X0_9FUNG|nr:hypothetical protein BDA99DRAFT_524777 [Phascolomyces articulosus]